MTARKMIQIARHPLARARAITRRAFTLIELMVAVGAIAIIAVGLAAVFASVGDTVTGGRAVSSFTAYASLLERQLRDDISKMSRDGFLLIVNQEADQGADIALFPGQAPARQRPRRIDEMVFFREGTFTSGREPLSAGFTARGNAAMIYYGHGTRQPVDENLGSTFVFPRADDGPDDPVMPSPSRRLEPVRLGDPTLPGDQNPNRYASDWSLLRLQVTLAPSSGSRREIPELFRLPEAARLDQDTQVGGQPAQRSIFRALWDVPAPAATGGGGPITTALGTIRSAAITGETPATNPLLTSGLVEVVTSDLDEIRRMVMWSPAPSGSGTSFDFVTPADRPTDLILSGYDGVIAPFSIQQAWMLDALPAPSVDFTSGVNGSSWSPSSPDLPPQWTDAPGEGDFRVRYEPRPPAYLEPMDLQPLARAVRLADQMALTSPMLAPQCTEFIVEWSFGKVAQDGSLIWHGAKRELDLDGDPARAPDRHAARPYRQSPYTDQLPDDPANLDPHFALPYRLLEPAPAGMPQFASEGDLFGSYPVSPQLIHGFASPGDEWTYDSGGRQVLASFFGYVDPTFNPLNPARPVGLPTLPAPFSSAPESASDYLPWAWPELIRITVSLADPSDPAIEQTFQFVFDAPGNPAP